MTRWHDWPVLATRVADSVPRAPRAGAGDVEGKRKRKTERTRARAKESAAEKPHVRACRGMLVGISLSRKRCTYESNPPRAPAVRQCVQNRDVASPRVSRTCATAAREYVLHTSVVRSHALRRLRLARAPRAACERESARRCLPPSGVRVRANRARLVLVRAHFPSPSRVRSFLADYLGRDRLRILRLIDDILPLPPLSSPPLPLQQNDTSNTSEQCKQCQTVNLPK